jgi:exopolysaccharide biosynthesis protein
VLSIKLFGSKSRRRDKEKPVSEDSGAPNKKKKKPHRGLRIASILLTIVLVLEGLYCFVVFTEIPAIKNLREMYIETAMSTMSHHWLAEWFFPQYMIDEIVQRTEDARNAQAGIISNWIVDNTEPTTTAEPSVPAVDAEEVAFYERFWELDKESFESYLEENPNTLADGWENIYINEAGLSDEGTSIRTTFGEQVLAIDAKNQILLIRVEGSEYIGVLAVAKDPSKLSCAPSSYIGSSGQQLGTIAENYGAVLGMTGSGFIDEGGTGSGGILAGYAMCQGKSYGYHYPYGYKRLELREDNRLYINDANSSVPDTVTDAVEFSPALIVDGTVLIDQFSGWNAINPRACIGQSDREEILMLVIEGRLLGRSLGTDVEECAGILKEHGAVQAMNLDGGTSAIMWFDGEYVTKCSNTAISSRALPNAWVYDRAE